MKSLLVVVCSFACAYAATGAVSDPVSVVLRSNYDQGPEGSFQYAFETDNGISANADGKVKNVGKDEAALEVTGSNQYIAPDGQKIETTYVANEFGYQPQGAHLPTTPEPIPIPDYIVRAIEYIAAHPQKEETVQKAG